MAQWERKKKQMAQRRALLQKRKQEETRLTNEANLLMKHAQKSAHNKQFDEAGRFYQQAAEIFKQLKWAQQAAMLESEVQNMVIKKQEYEENLRQQAEKLQQEKDTFNRRAEKIIEEKERKRQEEEEAARRKLSPVLQRKIDEAQYLIRKADKLAIKGKKQQAITRYRYVFKLYEEVDEITLDAATKKRLEEKIAKLQSLI